MQASINTGNSPWGASSLRHSRAGTLLVFVWCYFLLWGLFIVVTGLRADSGDWGLGVWLMIGAVLIPILLIPLYLYDCALRRQAPGFKPWLPWVFRLMPSILLAMVDSWAAGTDRRDPLFSYREYKLKDGGTGGSVGLARATPNLLPGDGRRPWSRSVVLVHAVYCGPGRRNTSVFVGYGNVEESPALLHTNREPRFRVQGTPTFVFRRICRWFVARRRSVSVSEK